MISHKIWEIWEDEDLKLAETGGHMTFEWDLTENKMTMSFQKEVMTPEEEKSALHEATCLPCFIFR